MAIINRRNEYQKSKLTTNQKIFLSLNYQLNTLIAKVQFSLKTYSATLEIYDLTGRSIAKKALSSTDKEVTLAVDTYPAGMYMLVVKQAGTILWQNKLIIK